MVRLQDKIQSDLKDAVKDNTKKEILKVIVGEMQRLSKKILSDDEVLRILKKLERNEVEVLIASGEDNSDFLNVVREYIPKKVDDNEISEWINSNIDFSKLQNKMQAIGIVMKEFGQKVDGVQVRNIVEKK